MTSQTLLTPAYLQKRYDYSCAAIESLRRTMHSTLAPLTAGSPLAVVSVGSYGRCEVSQVSDIDFFIVHDSSLPVQRLDQILRQVGDALRPVSHPGESDVAKFGRDALAHYADLSEHIGWKREGSSALTRRMLMLLEGRPLYGQAAFARWQHDLLRRYVPDDHGHGLARFLLNDLIRYYRTLMANFEEKRAEGKAWGVRNIKLLFSRKLLLAGGIVAVAEVHGLPAPAKVDRLRQLLALTPLQRLATLGADNPHSDALFEDYAVFLELISSAENRRNLDRLAPDQAMADPLYRQLRKRGQAFSLQLERWLRAQYPGHPILHAMCF
ncbi:hypothetical protein QSV36_23710 [Pseudomonas sp. BCRC 81390]|uniref:hypothetical protein n=1 Tax=Pseudomonas sp. BCRC 81390 TaxID=3054778 RepID=UPI00259AC465|nr:hypothetical protein [Pseudomonas sp. BCRC 81390]MDM3888582.1 hypothetical protein [Pseudomonas sp. BCRC 81390]